MRMYLCWIALLFLGLVRAASAQASEGLLVEHGRYTVHLLLHPVGSEEYGIVEAAPGKYVLTSKTAMADRGVPYTSTSTLTLGTLSTPSRFEQKIVTAGAESVTLAEMRPTTVVLQEGIFSRTLPKPAVAFPGSAEMPAAVEMLMMRYWNAHGRPKRLPLLHLGDQAAPLEIELVGHDAFYIKNQMVRLSRYTVKNLVFGREILWMNDSFRLAAVMTFAGGLPREVVLDEYESLTGEMLHNAIRQEMLDLATLERAVPPEAEGTYAIVGARLIDGTGAAPLEHATVIVRDGRIAACGAVTVPAGMRVIHAEGQTLLPGLWDLHMHYSGVELGPALLGAGITSARDIGGEMEFLTAMRRRLESGHGLGPQLMLAGSIDGGGPRGFGFVQAMTAAEGVAAVDGYADAKFDQVEVYPQLQPEAFRAVVAEANARGLTVSGALPLGMPETGAVSSLSQIDDLAPQPLSPRPGGDLVRRLERAVAGGTATMAAIRSVTLDAARAMKRDRDSGSIEVGKRADMILVQGDPLLQIGDLRRVSRVAVGGRLYEAARLNRSVDAGR